MGAPGVLDLPEVNTVAVCSIANDNNSVINLSPRPLRKEGHSVNQAQFREKYLHFITTSIANFVVHTNNRQKCHLHSLSEDLWKKLSCQLNHIWLAAPSFYLHCRHLMEQKWGKEKKEVSLDESDTFIVKLYPYTEPVMPWPRHYSWELSCSCLCLRCMGSHFDGPKHLGWTPQ